MQVHVHIEIMTTFICSNYIIYNFVFFTFYIWALLYGIKYYAHNKTAVLFMCMHILKFYSIFNYLQLSILYFLYSNTPSWFKYLRTYENSCQMHVHAQTKIMTNDLNSILIYLQLGILYLLQLSTPSLCKKKNYVTGMCSHILKL